MSRVIVIGAGFSKAVADAPLNNELFKLIYQEALRDCSKERPQRQIDRECFVALVNYLRKQAKPLINVLMRNGTQVETCECIPGLHPIDIEYLCTIIDLNIERPYIPKGIDVSLTGCPIPFMGGLTVYQLECARDFIDHCIVKLLLPERLTPDEVMMEKFANFIRAGDTIITFNYDLLVEQALWKNKLWSPVDGYCVGKIEEEEIINLNNVGTTEVHVIKLHGSVNWMRPTFLESEEKIKIRTTNPFTNVPLFDGLKANPYRVIPRWNYPIGSHVVMPTYMKSVRLRWELQLVRLASLAISRANEILILGYSFPEADAMAGFIFAQMPSHSKIGIVNSSGELSDNMRLDKRLMRKYGLKRDKITYEKNDIREWIKNDFKCVEYEKEKAIMKDIEELCDFGGNHNT